MTEISLFTFSAEVSAGYLNALVAATDETTAFVRLQKSDPPVWLDPKAQIGARGRDPAPPDGAVQAVNEGLIGFWVSQVEAPPIEVTDEMIAAGLAAFTQHGAAIARPKIDPKHIVREIYWAMAKLAGK